LSQESPAGRPSFLQIVKCLKEMASSLRPRKPRLPGSTGGRAPAKSRPSDLPPREGAPTSRAEPPAGGVPKASMSGREESQAASQSPFGAQSQPEPPPGGPFGAQPQPSTAGGPFAALAGPFGGPAQSPPPHKPEAVDRNNKSLSIGSAVDVGSEGRVVLSPRTALANSEVSLADPGALKDVPPPQGGMPVGAPVVSAFGALASLPKPEQ